MKEKISVVVDKELWSRFKEYCRTHGFSMSNKVEVLIRNELDSKTRREQKQKEVMDILAELIQEKKQTKTPDKTAPKSTKKASSSGIDLKSVTDRYFEKKYNR